MADQRSQAERWLSFAAGIVTPVTLITALLFYFGYVSARSQYEYFGIDVDTIGLSTQDYVMRSPQPLLVPLLVLSLLAVTGLLLHSAIQPRAAWSRCSGPGSWPSWSSRWGRSAYSCTPSSTGSPTTRSSYRW
jgi:hypothetical protein